MSPMLAAFCTQLPSTVARRVGCPTSSDGRCQVKSLWCCHGARHSFMQPSGDEARAALSD